MSRAACMAVHTILIQTNTCLSSMLFHLEPLAVAISPYVWLMTHYDWLTG